MTSLEGKMNLTPTNLILDITPFIYVQEYSGILVYRIMSFVMSEFKKQIPR